MAQPIVIFDGVWKKFRSGEHHDSLRDLIPSVIRSLTNGRRSSELQPKEFWALKDVSFSLGPGEAFGIVGPNGAGKSTILKLLNRLLKPTRGHAEIKGRTGALIEIAAGFHPDLTGRENVFLQGAIMGMTRKDIERKYDEIVEFAGVADFMDTPVKRFSTGMNARLGFSIAAHLDPDALIIDEVLSVGDMAFQQKCVARMREYKRKGVAIVFVSHNLQAVSDLCDQALYLKREPLAIGPTDQVLEKYLKDTTPVSGSKDSSIDILDVGLTTPSGQEVSSVRPGSEMVLRVKSKAKAQIRDYHVALLLYRSTDGLVVYDGHWTGEELNLAEIGPDNIVEFNLRFRANLTRGHYYAAWHIFHNPTQVFLAVVRPAGFFAVDEHRTWAGVADLEVEVQAKSSNG